MRGNREIDFRNDLCVYCGENLSTRQGDHVPPQGILPEEAEQVQVPCCVTCNGKHSNFDEIMRNKLVFLSTLAPQEVRDRAMNALMDNPGKFLQLEIHCAKDSAGQVRWMINFNGDPESLDKWFERIIRALVFHRSGVLLRSGLSFKTTVNFDRLVPPPELISSFDEDFDQLVLEDSRSPYFFSELFSGDLAEKVFAETKCKRWSTVFYRRVFFTTTIQPTK